LVSRYALVVRVPLWLGAFGLGSLTGQGFVTLVGRLHGFAGVAGWFASMLIVVFVTVSLVTAMEGLFPSLRRQKAKT
jgi:hypothetical protein